ncbi:hypothetical protein POSPLADRAFT_1067051 [Postia placenta MAD-698-R-SB12]|uniref:Uncharacterized protein n=1 Tax=Postia placenta MAD-698-R-SB12 TaxID=670580 RepID=A0A1X6MUT2_9APHY|nr:hypothetical protein POSPLADRAFT_1067051 [Postia placenta MAD-698-R-SB12]OSX60079.1 hypothetical protein POSPLADRAFT_1067051 [Postia placenta MAD-698-R-SB12]
MLIGFVCCVRCPATLRRATTQCIMTSPIYICQERKFRGRLVCLGVRPCDCSSLAKQAASALAGAHVGRFLCLGRGSSTASVVTSLLSVHPFLPRALRLCAD